jgi:hypothetical protein
VLRVLGRVFDPLELDADLVDLGDHCALVRLLSPDLRRRVGARHARSGSRRECGEGERTKE